MIDSRFNSGLKFTIFFNKSEAVSSRFSKNISVKVKCRFLIFLPFGINRNDVSTASSFIGFFERQRKCDKIHWAGSRPEVWPEIKTDSFFKSNKTSGIFDC